MDHLLKHGIKLGIVTSSIQETFDRKFSRKQGLAAKFEVIVTGDKVKNGKPAPDGYVDAARLLGSNPSECLVIEDAPVGFQVHCLSPSPLPFPVSQPRERNAQGPWGGQQKGDGHQAPSLRVDSCASGQASPRRVLRDRFSFKCSARWRV